MEMIKIENREGKQVVSARELYLFLGVGRDFTTWIKAKIEKYDFIENVDFIIVSNAPQNGGASHGGQNKLDYIISMDMAKELSMVENNVKGKEARRYFIECENKLKSKQIPTNYLEALKELVKVEEEKVALQSKVAILTHVNKLYTSTEIAKELGMKSATELNRKLADLKVQYKVNNTWVLTAKYSNLGYESIKQTVLDAGKVIYDRKFTQLGRDFILGLLGGNVCLN